MKSYRLSLALALLGFVMLGVSVKVLASPAPIDAESAPLAVELRNVTTKLAQAQSGQPQAQPTSAAPAANPPAQAAADEPVGNVATLTGIATVIRNKNSLPLKLRDDIFLNDTLQTSSNSSLSVTFNDATTFNLSANAKITIDNYVYEEGGKQNAGVFDVGKGTVAFVAAAVAKTGDMRIDTPTASLGIRGTTGLVEVPEGRAAAGANDVIKLYPDADGRVGRIEINDRTGQRLGALTQRASGFTIRPGIGGARVTAVPLTISPQQAARDQGFVRQVHAVQNVGRQIVTEQRAIRRANPTPNAPNRSNPPGPQRQNQLPGQNRPGQPQQGAPNRNGQQQQQPGRQGRPQQPGTPEQQRQGTGPQQPGTPQQQRRQGTGPQQQQPGEPPRQGQTPQQNGQATPQHTAPATQPRQVGPRPASNLQRPSSPGRPALQRQRAPAPPKGRPEKQKQQH